MQSAPATVGGKRPRTDCARACTVSCTYLRPAPEGSTVYVESKVVHLGKRMGMTTGTMRIGSRDGKAAYTCEHSKVNMAVSSL